MRLSSLAENCFGGVTGSKTEATGGGGGGGSLGLAGEKNRIVGFGLLPLKLGKGSS